MEVHIHPFEVFSKYKNKSINKYLHTSPEFAMKKILADVNELNNIFTLSYCFRDEPNSPIHRNQFIMCEWYRKNEFYTKIMNDCEKLILFCIEELTKNNIDTIKPDIHFQRTTIQDLFKETLNIDILNFLDTNDLRELIKKDFKDVPLPDTELTWDDYYFLLFLNKIEPILKNYPYILLYNFPHHLKALSTINENDKRVCDRFEIYMNGIELCNSFNELTDFNKQKERFNIDGKLKREIYNYELPSPKEFYKTLEKGLPKSSGIALGVERLLICLTDKDQIFFS